MDSQEITGKSHRSPSLQDLLAETSQWLRIQGNHVAVEKSARGHMLKEPVQVSLDSILEVGQKGLVKYIIASLSVERPKLIPFTFENKSLIELARYFLRYRSASTTSLYAYIDSSSRYARFTGYSPDELIRDVKKEDGTVDYEKLPTHVRILEDYVAKLQDDGLSPSRVQGCVKHIKTVYRVNGVPVNLPYPLSRRVVYKDRAPKPEELGKLIEISSLREKVIIAILALSGMREGTLVRLNYRHVKEDLERNITPLHIHVETEITKGKYHDYDTFLAKEAVEYLRLYLDGRRKGTPSLKIPQEKIDDDAPLIRDGRSREVKPISEKQIRKLIHNLYLKADLIKPNLGRMYELRVHSLRKYFKTQMEALGVKSDYTEYMMGHAISTYHDIQSQGVDFLRNIYARSGLSIKPKTNVSKIDMLKEIIRAWGMEPEKLLVKEAMAEPHRTYIDQTVKEEDQLTLLSHTLKDLVKKELQS